MIKGVLKSKKGKLKAAYFQPLTQLNIVASHQEKRNLQSIREAQVIIHVYQFNSFRYCKAICGAVSSLKLCQMQFKKKNPMNYFMIILKKFISLARFS